MFHTATRKKRLIGVVLLVVILALFFSFNRLPKLDIVGEDLDAVTAPQVQCFQGFCLEREPGVGFFERWTSFSVTYLRLVSVGMTFAFLVAGLAEAFLFANSYGPAPQSGGMFRRTLRGAVAGPVMNLCSACIVPVSSSFHRRAGLEGAISMVQGSATMNIPALAMVFFVFTPMLGVSRLVLAVVGALIIGPIVVMTVRRERGPDLDIPTTIATGMETEVEEAGDWRTVITDGTRMWAKTSLGYLVRMGPIMVVAGFASGLVIQWLSPESVANYLGNDLRGIAIAATFGILINVPLLFEIPLVALLLLMGMGTAPAATLLFTAAAGGPVTFWGLSRLMPKKSLAAFAGSTWALGAIGGLGVLAVGTLFLGFDENLRSSVTRASDTVERPRVGHPPLQVQSSPIFVDVTQRAGITFQHQPEPGPANTGYSAGALALDFDGDGWDDIYLTNSDGPNALYRNNGDGTFTDVAAAWGVAAAERVSNGGCAADYDNDGNQDLYLTNYQHSQLFHNSGTGGFADVTGLAFPDAAEDIYRSTGCAWGDYDQDGYLDLIVLRHRRTLRSAPTEGAESPRRSDPLALYRNNGDGAFTDVTEALGDAGAFGDGPPVGSVWGAGSQPIWADLDHDGDPDLYLVNDFGRSIQPNVLFRNDGADSGSKQDWRFTDVSSASGAGVAALGRGVAVADYDRDGYLDIFASSIGDSYLLRNTGSGLTFTDATDAAGTGVGYSRDPEDTKPRIGWGALFLDYDNDGYEDLHVVRGHLEVGIPNPEVQTNVLLQNQGDGRFVDVSPASGADHGGVGRGAFYFDYNGDGCLDIFVANLGQGPALLQNVCASGNHWLEISLEGRESNQDGIGARVSVTAGDVTQIREMRAGDSFMGQNMTPVHFGLGVSDSVDSITIQWPSGQAQTLLNVAPDRRISVAESHD